MNHHTVNTWKQLNGNVEAVLFYDETCPNTNYKCVLNDFKKYHQFDFETQI